MSRISKYQSPNLGKKETVAILRGQSEASLRVRGFKEGKMVFPSSSAAALLSLHNIDYLLDITASQRLVEIQCRPPSICIFKIYHLSGETSLAKTWTGGVCAFGQLHIRSKSPALSNISTIWWTTSRTLVLSRSTTKSGF